jgi:hypothetical protein
MTRGRLVSHLGLAIGFALAFGSSSARAGNPCVGDAIETFADCKGDCKEGYQVAKDACLNRDHDCVERCREVRGDCIDQTNLDEDLAACRDTLRAAKQICRDTKPADSPELDQCIDEAQVVAFVCRKTARKTNRPAVTTCRTAFRTCAKACGPPIVTNPDPRQCKLDAKDAYVACKGDCREQFQAQKDLCLNRDHDCVEACRAGRDTCLQPKEDQLDAAIAACNATRASAVQNCENLYPPGTDRDTCVMNAQVDAFQCRDQAREDAKPGFDSCRATFQSCATACGPAS